MIAPDPNCVERAILYLAAAELIDPAPVEAMAARTLSDPSTNPTTGADLGAGPGAGLTSDGDKGSAKDINDAERMAKAMTVKPQ